MSEPDFGADNSGHDTDCDCKACLIDTWHGEVEALRHQLAEATATTGVAWRVTFKRDRLVPDYKQEQMVVVAPELQLQLLLDGVRSVHPEAIVVTADRLGDAVWSS